MNAYALTTIYYTSSNASMVVGGVATNLSVAGDSFFISQCHAEAGEEQGADIHTYRDVERVGHKKAREENPA